MEVLAVIPARSGSKGLPGKNSMHMAGHPLLAYSILAAKNAQHITRIICNTDAQELADIARAYGAEVPFLRPATLAQDDSTDLELFHHMLEWLRTEENYRPDIIVQLRPTSPLRKKNWIDDAISQMLEIEADSLRTITESLHTPYKMWHVQDGILQPLLQVPGMEEAYNQPRQKLPPTFWQTGTIDILRSDKITAHSLSGNSISGFMIERKYAVDIDDLDAFLQAEKMILAGDCLHF